MNNDEVLELVKKFNSALNAYDNEPTFYTSSMDTLESFSQIVISEQAKTIVQLQAETTKLREDIAEYLALPKMHCTMCFQ